MAAEPAVISIDEDAFNYRVDVPAFIRISSVTPENGCISSLRCHAFPKGHAQALAPGFYIFNQACGLDVARRVALVRGARRSSSWRSMLSLKLPEQNTQWLLLERPAAADRSPWPKQDARCDRRNLWSSPI